MLEQPQAGLIGRFYRQVENRPKKAVSCIYCGKVYTSSHSLTSHVKSEHYKFSCKDCDKSFATQNFLNVHANR